MNDHRVHSLGRAFAGLSFLPDRKPDSDAALVARAFATLAPYRDGQIFIGHYAGTSQWERHPRGDELVMVIDGQTELTIIVEGSEHRHRMVSGDVFVVPERHWHRFDTPEAVKVLTVTPQPTDHRLERPEG